MARRHHGEDLDRPAGRSNATLATIEQARHSGDYASYVDTIWNIVNWSDVADRFAHVCHGT